MNDLSSDAAQKEDRKTRVFISYSRKDGEFAERLRDDLNARGYEAYLDKHDIRPGEPWRERLSDLIARADTVIFCLSNNFVRSEICDWEVNEAERVGKRLVPTVVNDPDKGTTPRRLERLNYIFLRNESEYSEGLEKIQFALDNDIEWIKINTRLTERSIEWVAAGRSEAGLLRGHNISDAEKWIMERPNDGRNIAEQVGQFISASRQAETVRERRARLRSRIISGVSIVVAIVFACLGYLMFNRWQEELKLQSLYLADLSRQALAEGEVERAQLFALEGLRDTGKSSSFAARWRPLVPEAQFAFDATDQRGQWQGHALTGHTVNVTSAQFSPDEKNVLTASRDGTARIWDVRTGLPLRLLDHPEELYSASYSPDGRHVLTYGSDVIIRLWEVETSRLIWRRRVLTNTPKFSPDGETIVVSDQQSIKLLKASSGEILKELENRKTGTRPVHFSPDGEQILSWTGDNTGWLWSVTTGKVIAKLEGHSADITFAAFSSNGDKVLTSSEDKTVRIWDAKKGQFLQALIGHEHPVKSGAFSEDGSLVLTVAYEGAVRLWATKSGTLLRQLEGTGSSADAAYLSPDANSILTVTSEGLIRLWDVASGKATHDLEGHNGPARSVHFSTDGTKILTATKDRTPRVWEKQIDQLTLVLPKHLGGTANPEISPDGKHLLVSARDGPTNLWNLTTSTHVKTLPGKLDYKSQGFSPDGSRIVTVGSNRDGLQLWMPDGRKVNGLKIENGHVHSPVFSPDSKWIATLSITKDIKQSVPIVGSTEVSGATFHLWNARTGEHLRPFQSHTHGVTSIAFSSDSKQIVSTSADKSVQVWSTQIDGRPIKLPVPNYVHYSAKFSPDHNKIIVTSGKSWGELNKVLLWDNLNKRVAKEIHIEGGFHSHYSPSFTPDGKRFLTTALVEGKVHVRDAQTGDALMQLDHDRGVVNAQYSSDGSRILVAGSENSAVWLWDSETGKLLRTINKQSGYVHAKFSMNGQRLLLQHGNEAYEVLDSETGKTLSTPRPGMKSNRSALSPTGDRIAISLSTGAVQVWDLKPIQSRIDIAKSKLRRCLPPAERIELHLSPAAPPWCYRYRIHPYDQILPKAGIIETQVAWLGDQAASFLGNENEVTKWLKKQAWLQSAEKHLQSGHENMKAKRYSGALADYQAATSLVSADYRQNIELLTSKAKRALAASLTKEGKELLAAGKTTEAQTKFTEALKHDASQGHHIAKIKFKHHSEKGKALSRDKKFGAAQDAYATSINLARRSKLWDLLASRLFDRGMAYKHQSQLTLALADLREARRLGNRKASTEIYDLNNRLVLRSLRERKWDAALVSYIANYLELDEVTRQRLVSDYQLPIFRSTMITIANLYAEQQAPKVRSDSIAKCDKLATTSSDPFRVADPVDFRLMNAIEAAEECSISIEEEPDEPRYRLNRSMANYSLYLIAEVQQKTTEADELIALVKSDLQAAMTMPHRGVVGYAPAFDISAQVFGNRQTRHFDWQTVRNANKLFLKSFNRTIHCCITAIVRHLIKQANQNGFSELNKVISALVEWAVALGSADAMELRKELLASGNMKAATASPGSATFTSRPPWLPIKMK